MDKDDRRLLLGISFILVLLVVAALMMGLSWRLFLLASGIGD